LNLQRLEGAGLMYPPQMHLHDLPRGEGASLVCRKVTPIVGQFGQCVWGGGDWVGGGSERAGQVAHVSVSEGLFEPLFICLKEINRQCDAVVRWLNTRMCILDPGIG
jgi:hypothetical protein